MSTCQSYEGYISEYIEGELSGNAKQAIEKHISECHQCAQKINNVRTLRQMLNELPRVRVSADFDNMLRARIRLEARNRRKQKEGIFSSRKIRIPVYGISFAIVILALTLLFSQITSQRRSYPEAAANAHWKDVPTAEQRSASRSVTLYSIDREPIIKIFSRQNLRSFKRSSTAQIAKKDSTYLYAQEAKLNQSVGRYIQTTTY